MTLPPFPILLDSSMLATAKACPRRFLFEYILNRVPATPSFHLTAGSAYARGHQVFRELYYGEGAPKEDALTAGLVALTKTYGPDDPPDPTNPKTYRRTAAALVGYYHEWPPETDFIRPHTINSQPCTPSTPSPASSSPSPFPSMEPAAGLSSPTQPPANP